MPLNLRTLLKRGMSLKCGQCGQGKLFKSYLKFDNECPVCKLDYSITDTADGPAFFVGFSAMILFAPLFLIIAFLPISKTLMGIGYVLASVACLGFCLGLLPIFKAILFNLQIHHRAGDCDFDYVGTHGTAPDNWPEALKRQPKVPKK